MKKRLNKLSILYYVGPFVVTFFICLFVLLMQFLWKYVDDLVGKGLEWYVIAELLFYASAHLIPLALPLAILLSSIMTFGNLAENNELMAYKSAGISLIRVMRPLIFLIILFSISAFYISNNMIPRANLKFGSLLWDVRKQKPALDIRPGIFYNNITNYSIRIAGKNDETGDLNDVLIYDHSNRRGNDVVIRAERGSMKTTPDKLWLILTLYNGERYEEVTPSPGKRQDFPHNRMKFQEYIMRFDLSEFQLSRSNDALFKDHYKMLNVSQLDLFIDSFEEELSKRQVSIRRYMDPYFKPLRDSAFFERDTIAGVEIAASGDFISRFKSEEQKSLITKATNYARSVRGIVTNNSEEIERQKYKISRYKMEWHRKFTLSFACILLFFIGAPLGAVIRKGGLGMPAVVSIILFIIFHVISITGEKMAKQMVLSPFWGMWISVFILFPVGIFITFLANQDSILLSREGYSKFFLYIKHLFVKERKNQR